MCAHENFVDLYEIPGIPAGVFKEILPRLQSPLASIKKKAMVETVICLGEILVFLAEFKKYGQKFLQPVSFDSR